MKHLTLTSILLTTILYHFDVTHGQNNRRWLEIDNRLFRIEPDGLYTWQQAIQECKNDRTDLIQPKNNYDYTKLKDAIKQTFRNYSSFWTSNQIQFTTIFDHLGMGKSKDKQMKCKKFDSTAGGFKFVPDDCDKTFGFICERSLLADFSVFSDKQKQKEYLIQTARKFMCEETYNECEKQHMSLITLKEYVNNTLLKDYIFHNYGSSPDFLFNFNNETHYNCATFKRNQNFHNRTRLGYICEREIIKSSLSTRHFVLIIFLSVAVIGAILIYIFGRCCCNKKSQVVEISEDRRDFKISDVK